MVYISKLVATLIALERSAFAATADTPAVSWEAVKSAECSLKLTHLNSTSSSTSTIVVGAEVSVDKTKHFHGHITYISLADDRMAKVPLKPTKNQNECTQRHVFDTTLLLESTYNSDTDYSFHKKKSLKDKCEAYITGFGNELFIKYNMAGQWEDSGLSKKSARLLTSAGLSEKEDINRALFAIETIARENYGDYKRRLSYNTLTQTLDNGMLKAQSIGLNSQFQLGEIRIAEASPEKWKCKLRRVNTKALKKVKEQQKVKSVKTDEIGAIVDLARSLNYMNVDKTLKNGVSLVGVPMNNKDKQLHVSIRAIVVGMTD